MFSETYTVQQQQQQNDYSSLLKSSALIKNSNYNTLEMVNDNKKISQFKNDFFLGERYLISNYDLRGFRDFKKKDFDRLKASYLDKKLKEAGKYGEKNSKTVESLKNASKFRNSQKPNVSSGD